LSEAKDMRTPVLKRINGQRGGRPPPHGCRHRTEGHAPAWVTSPAAVGANRPDVTRLRADPVFWSAIYRRAPPLTPYPGCWPILVAASAGESHARLASPPQPRHRRQPRPRPGIRPASCWRAATTSSPPAAIPARPPS
jgi:hypothetical protein